jgi:hypothetical protein
MIFIGLSCRVWVRIAARPSIGWTYIAPCRVFPLVFTRVLAYSLSLQLIVKEVYILHDIVCVQNFFTIYEKGLIWWVIRYGSKA